MARMLYPLRENRTPEGSFDYLATPYSHPDALVRHVRACKARELAARLMKMGYTVFSPIVYTHQIEVYEMTEREVRSFADFWHRQDVPVLRHAGRLLVARFDGWAVSAGIQKERILAMQMGIPEFHLDPYLFGMPV